MKYETFKERRTEYEERMSKVNEVVNKLEEVSKSYYDMVEELPKPYLINATEQRGIFGKFGASTINEMSALTRVGTFFDNNEEFSEVLSDISKDNEYFELVMSYSKENECYRIDFVLKENSPIPLELLLSKRDLDEVSEISHTSHRNKLMIFLFPLLDLAEFTNDDKYLPKPISFFRNHASLINESLTDRNAGLLLIDYNDVQKYKFVKTDPDTGYSDGKYSDSVPFAMNGIQKTGFDDCVDLHLKLYNFLEVCLPHFKLITQEIEKAMKVIGDFYYKYRPEHKE